MDGAIEGRRRRRHSAQFKAKVVLACTPGVSVAAVALAHGLNANLVRRWLQKRDAIVPGAVAQAPVKVPAPAFLPVQIQNAAPAPDIRLELRRGAATVVVSWPALEAAACGRWLTEWLG